MQSAGNFDKLPLTDAQMLERCARIDFGAETPQQRTCLVDLRLAPEDQVAFIAATLRLQPSA